MFPEVDIVAAIQKIFHRHRSLPIVCHVAPGEKGREEAEAFVAEVFQRRYGATVRYFAPNLMLLKQAERIVATVGWRSAGQEQLFLETYLDAPIEQTVARLAGQPVAREAIVEVGNLASDRPGGCVDVILNLARHLDQQGYEWVVFTATRELIHIFRRVGLPPLALASADPSRLGEAAADWGSYYSTHPVVVAGRIRLALDKVSDHG